MITSNNNLKLKTISKKINFVIQVTVGARNIHCNIVLTKILAILKVLLKFSFKN